MPRAELAVTRTLYLVEVPADDWPPAEFKVLLRVAAGYGGVYCRAGKATGPASVAFRDRQSAADFCDNANNRWKATR